MKNIAVVGGGIFGIVSALKLSQAGHSVHLYEKRACLLEGASAKNQYRLHRGYHYPRSIETALQSDSGYISFLKEYPDCITKFWQRHYYAIANESKVSFDEYRYFLKQCNLTFREMETPSFIDASRISAYVEVAEHSLDFDLFANKLENQLSSLNVVVHLNSEFHPEMTDDYEVVINATYSNSNFIVPADQRIDYQFEICEKPIVRLNSTFKDKSIVVIDGNFGCLDPVGKNHYLGHVRDAIHHVSTGHFPEIPDGYNGLLKALRCPPHPKSKIHLILDSLEEFFPTIRQEIEYMGSMYVIRTVLPNREHDDARPSYITKHSDRLYSIFSGKIGTCVDIANELVAKI